MGLNIFVADNSVQMGNSAAHLVATLLNNAVKKQGTARIVLSTGASQFEMFDALVKEDVQWSKVEMFHLCEYVGIPESHIASFRRYLKERFISKVNLKAYFFVDGEGNIKNNIEKLSAELKTRKIDVGVIGIGENGHIAFNDPPADFNSVEAYRVVELDERSRMQQVGEGWFDKLSSVPHQAISMLPRQIMACETIVSVVPHKVKAEAVLNALTGQVCPSVPASLLKTHPDWHLFLDRDSASLLFSL